tara:strand:- start:72 stop:620 length:549 start_codon:yes stop_codon:yes gene_type:complete
MDDIQTANKLLAQSEIFLPDHQVQNIVSRLAQELNKDMQFEFPVVIPVMTGGLVFCGQLLPLLDFPLQLDYMHVTRYRGETKGSEIEWKLKPQLELNNRNILIVDDILDEGKTASAIMKWLKESGANKITLCVLFNKKIGKPKPIMANYVGLDIEDKYVFGFGMDIKNFWRNLSSIRAYKGE